MDNTQIAGRLASLGVPQHAIEKHLAGLANAASYRAAAASRRAEMAALAKKPEPVRRQRQRRPMLTEAQIEALLVILRAGPSRGALWRYQARPPVDGAAWLWPAIVRSGVTEAGFPDRPLAVTNVLYQLRRAGLISPQIGRARVGSRWASFKFIHVVCDAPTPATTVIRERLPTKPMVRERLPMPARPVVVRERLWPVGVARLPVQADLGVGRSQVADARSAASVGPTYAIFCFG